MILLLHLCVIFFIFTLNSNLITEIYPCFQQYVQKFGKTYEQDQYKKREIIYNFNIQYIKSLTSKSPNALGLNNYTDWTKQEMKKKKGALQPFPKNNIATKKPVKLIKAINLPTSYDWRNFNAVTSVKNQGSCGSCWAFGTTAFFQSDLIVNQGFNNTIDLSQQYLLSCSNRSFGCNGGQAYWAIQDVIYNGGIPTQKQYPYDFVDLATDGICLQDDLIKINKNRQLLFYSYIYDQQFLKQLILKKPITINVCSDDFQYYQPSQKTRTLTCGFINFQLDHTVLLVGYTPTQWIIKNSWSSDWGVDGYIYISRQQFSDCCIGDQLFTTGLITPKCSVDDCLVCIEEQFCSQCKDGYYVIGFDDFQFCFPCFNLHCKECLNYYGTCNQCQDGYALIFPDYQCSKTNLTNCSLIVDDQCRQCNEGWLLSNDGKCVKK